MKLPDHLKLFISGTLISIIGNIVLGLINYLVRRVMANELTAVDYGSFYGIFSLVTIIISFCDLGMVNAGTILIAEDRSKNREIFSGLFLFKLLFGLTFGILMLALGNVISNHYLSGGGCTMICIMACYLVLASANGAFLAYYNGNMLYKEGKLLRCSFAILLLLLTMFLTPEMGGTGAAVAYLMAFVIYIPFNLLYVFHHGKFGMMWRIPKETLRRFLHLFGAVSVIVFMQTLLFNMDSVMLTYLKGAESTAVYNVALPVTQLLLSVLVFHIVFTPFAVKLVKEQKMTALRGYVIGAIVGTLCIIPVAFYACNLFGAWLISLLFNSQYAGSASQVLPYLFCGYILYSFGAFVMQILLAMQAKKTLMFIAVTSVLLNFILNIIFIQRYGVIGAALATLAGYLYFAVFCSIVFFYKCSAVGKELKDGKELFTFAICAYKDSPYLEEAVRSAKDQTMESAIVIATSTPSAYIENIAKKYDVSYKVNPESRGIASDWEFALSQIRTPYGMIMHQDDMYFRDYARKVTAAFLRHPDAAIVFTDYGDLTEDGGVHPWRFYLFVKRLLLWAFYIKPYHKSRFFKRSAVAFGNAISCPSVSYNMSHRADFTFDRNYSVNLDWAMWLSLADKPGTFVYERNVLMAHRINDKMESASAIADKRRYNEDLSIFTTIWGAKFSRFLMKFYRKAYDGCITPDKPEERAQK